MHGSPSTYKALRLIGADSRDGTIRALFEEDGAVWGQGDF